VSWQSVDSPLVPLVSSLPSDCGSSSPQPYEATIPGEGKRQPRLIGWLSSQYLPPRSATSTSTPGTDSGWQGSCAFPRGPRVWPTCASRA